MDKGERTENYAIHLSNRRDDRNMFTTIKLFFKWWKTWKTLPVLSWVQGAKHYRDGNYEAAIRCYERGIKKRKEHPAQYCARMDLAYCLFRQRRVQDAEAHLKFVTTNLPKSREAFLRLARLQIWTGRSLDAAWTMRRALRTIEANGEAIALFMFAVLDNGGPAFLLKEVIDASMQLSQEERNNPKLIACRARLMMLRGNEEKGREYLEKSASQEDAPVEALLLFAEVLISEGKVAWARKYLRQAMLLVPEHPRVLSLLATSYLKSGPFYNPDYAKQLATDACQNTTWLSPREMHVLAESYFHLNDRMSALIIASKAKEEGSRLLGTYRDSAGLDRLIEDLSTGTQA